MREYIYEYNEWGLGMDPYGKEAWMASQLQLARLYREQGWLEEADQIAEELAVLMAAADADFWLVRELAVGH